MAFSNSIRVQAPAYLDLDSTHITNEVNDQPSLNSSERGGCNGEDEGSTTTCPLHKCKKAISASLHKRTRACPMSKQCQQSLEEASAWPTKAPWRNARVMSRATPVPCPWPYCNPTLSPISCGTRLEDTNSGACHGAEATPCLTGTCNCPCPCSNYAMPTTCVHWASGGWR